MNTILKDDGVHNTVTSRSAIFIYFGLIFQGIAVYNARLRSQTNLKDHVQKIHFGNISALTNINLNNVERKRPPRNVYPPFNYWLHPKDAKENENYGSKNQVAKVYFKQTCSLKDYSPPQCPLRWMETSVDLYRFNLFSWLLHNINLLWQNYLSSIVSLALRPAFFLIECFHNLVTWTADMFRACISLIRKYSTALLNTIEACFSTPVEMLVVRPLSFALDIISFAVEENIFKVCFFLSHFIPRVSYFVMLILQLVYYLLPITVVPLVFGIILLGWFFIFWYAVIPFLATAWFVCIRYSSSKESRGRCHLCKINSCVSYIRGSISCIRSWLNGETLKLDLRKKWYPHEEKIKVKKI